MNFFAAGMEANGMSRHRRVNPRTERKELMGSNDFKELRPRTSVQCVVRTSVP
jgi:hypothetical protein